LTGDGGEDMALLLENGEKVGAGQAAAVLFAAGTDRGIVNEIRSVETQIQQIELVRESDSAGNSAPTINSSAVNVSMELTRALSERSLEDIGSISARLRTLAYFGENGIGKGETDARLNELRSTLSALKAELERGAKYIYAHSAGVFSQETDGYEYLSPDTVNELSTQDLRAVMNTEKGGGTTGTSKVITDIRWYYAALMDYSEAKKLDGGSEVTVRFDRYCSDEVTMLVENVGVPDSNGECVVVLSARRNMAEISGARRVDGMVVYSKVNGIRVPKKAIRMDEDSQTCVYTLTGARAELKRVEIIHEVGEYYIVKNADAANDLREGDQVIVRGKALYDGKVVA